jgi:hypothetical protein
MRRKMLDDGNTSGVQVPISVVKTARELRAAVDEGAEHIEVQSHMTLTELELRDSFSGTKAILVIPDSVTTLTVCL